MPRRIPGPERARRALAAAALALALAAPGCARKGPPSGGPPDLEAPRVVQTSPDSGAANVATDAHVVVTFSEGMEPRGTGAAVDLAPPVPIRQRRWAGRTLTMILADSLKRDHTYTLFVGGGARDLHGNSLGDVRTVVFTTAARFPAGGLEGRIDAVGFPAPGTLLWCYRDGRAPDSTARDFDALGVADAQGHFRISGLAVPARWRIWGFADLNKNRSFEPEYDLLVASDTTIALDESAPVASGLVLHMINPHAPGRFAGSVVDSVSDGTGVLRLIVTAPSDTTRKLSYEVGQGGGFDFKWDPGVYRVRAYRDMDRNRAWKRDTEPASEELVVRIEPAGSVAGVTFTLARPVPEGQSP